MPPVLPPVLHLRVQTEDDFYSAGMKFENDVKMYGTQTSGTNVKVENQFENDVKMYGTQTTVYGANDGFKFENDVKMYGTQT